MCELWINPVVSKAVRVLGSSNSEEKKSYFVSATTISFLMLLTESIVFLYVSSENGFQLETTWIQNIAACTGKATITVPEV